MTWFTILAIALSIGFIFLGRYYGFDIGTDYRDDNYVDLSDITDFFD